jgi:hypothetical protein
MIGLQHFVLEMVNCKCKHAADPVSRGGAGLGWAATWGQLVYSVIHSVENTFWTLMPAPAPV